MISMYVSVKMLYFLYWCIKNGDTKSIQIFLKSSGNCSRAVRGMKKSSNPVIDRAAVFGPTVG